MESFPFKNISSFEIGKTALTGHKMSFYASGNKVVMKWIHKGQIKEFMDYVKQQMDSTHRSDEKKDVVDSIPDQIEKLSGLKDKGIISEQEFQNKKEELLSKM